MTMIATWHTLDDWSPDRDLDVYHEAAYLASVVPADGDVRILTVEGSAGRLVLPLVIRPLPFGLAGSDAESPYGYAAPWWRGDASDLWPQAVETLRQVGIANVFLRNHPLWELEPPPATPITTAPTAVIPLTDGRAAAFAGSRCANHRSQVNRARGLGFTTSTVTAPTGAALADFRDRYDATMERLGAAGFYRFPAAAYDHLARLGERLSLITVADAQGAVHNQALFLRGATAVHYHLSARAAESHNAAGNLLFEAAADWAVAHGCTAIHLGGGTSGRDDDPLLAFKRRIGRQDAVFRTHGLVADVALHETAIATWRERGGDDARWFQAYRQPLPC